MTEDDTTVIIINRTLEINLTENGNQYTTKFYKIDHLLSGLSVLDFSVASFADYMNQIFSPSEELNKPNFFNIIKDLDGEIYIYTILVLVMNEFIDHQSVCVSQEDRKLLHLVTLDEYYNPDVKK